MRNIARKTALSICMVALVVGVLGGVKILIDPPLPKHQSVSTLQPRIDPPLPKPE